MVRPLVLLASLALATLAHAQPAGSPATLYPGLEGATLREAISFQQGEPTDPPAHPGLAATGNPSTPRAGI